MKKFISIILCFTLTLLTAACSKTTESPEDLNTQYTQLISKYEADYGTITKDRRSFCLNDALGGVSYIELIDFDNNGSDELLIIFDQNTKQNNLNGALTCHIYAEVDGKATFVYEQNLAIADIRTTVANTIGCDFKGRTLCLTSDNGKTGIIDVRMHTIELEHYPLKIKDSSKSEPITTYNHSFLEYTYLSFNGTDFVADTTIAIEKGSPSSNLFLLNGETCSEYTFNENKTPVTKYIEASTHLFDKALKQIDSTKAALGMEPTVLSEYTPQVLKPQLTQKEIYSKYSNILKDYKDKYGEITPPEVENAPITCDGVAYTDLIDFNNDGFKEFLIVYGTLNKKDTHHYSPEEHIFICEIFGTQATEVVNLVKLNLPVNDYRGLMGKTLWLAEQNGKTYLCNYMNYTLHMPEEGLSDFTNVDDKYHQFFTADCYFAYNGEKFVLENKFIWQGERDDMITMVNDKRCSLEEFHKYQHNLDAITKKIDIYSDYNSLMTHNAEIEKELNK